MTIILLSASCKNKIETIYSYDDIPIVKHSILDSIALPLDDESNPYLNNYQLIRGDTLKLIFLNDLNKSIYIYDFYNESLVKKITLKSNVGSIPDLMSFYYINHDSIILLPLYGDYLLLCNSEGQINSSKIQFVDEDDNNNIESHRVSSSNPLTFSKGKIYINNSFGWIATEKEEDKYLIIEYDFKNETSLFFLKHPEIAEKLNYENSAYRHLSFHSEDDSKIVFSFNFSSSLYELNLDNKKIIKLTSDELDLSNPIGLKPQMSSDDQWMHFQTNYTFSTITEDIINNNIIRVLLKPYNIDEINEGIVNVEKPKKADLLIYDNNYNLQGRISLRPDKFYYFINIFSDKKGIWIQRINDNEDEIFFEHIAYESN